MMRALGLAALLFLAACATTPPTRASAPIIAPPATPKSETPAPAAERAPERAAAKSLKTNAAAIKIIKASEALRLDSYELGGSEFIGYGHLMKQGEADHITEDKAEALLKSDLGDCEATLGARLTTPVSVNEFSGLVSLCFNIGAGNIATSSAVKRLNEGDRAGAADAFLLWNKDDGKVLDRLVARRKDERALFLKP